MDVHSQMVILSQLRKYEFNLGTLYQRLQTNLSDMHSVWHRPMPTLDTGFLTSDFHSEVLLTSTQADVDEFLANLCVMLTMALPASFRILSLPWIEIPQINPIVSNTTSNTCFDNPRMGTRGRTTSSPRLRRDPPKWLEPPWGLRAPRFQLINHGNNLSFLQGSPVSCFFGKRI